MKVKVIELVGVAVMQLTCIWDVPSPSSGMPSYDFHSYFLKMAH